MKKILPLFIGLLFLSTTAFAGIDFDGADDFLDVGTLGNAGVNMDTSPLTLACWIKSSNTTALLQVCGTINTGSTTFIQVNLNSDSVESVAAGNIFVSSRDQDANRRSGAVESDTGVTDGNWHYLYIEFHVGVSHVVYLDGVEKTVVQSSTDNVDNTANFAFPLYIGARNLRGTADINFDGIITEFVMWQKTTAGAIELTQAEIDLLAKAKIKRMPLQIRPSDIVFYIPTDDEPDGTSFDGDTAVDRSGNGNDGTGNDGANNTGLTAKAEEVLSYP